MVTGRIHNVLLLLSMDFVTLRVWDKILSFFLWFYTLWDWLYYNLLLFFLFSLSNLIKYYHFFFITFSLQAYYDKTTVFTFIFFSLLIFLEVSFLSFGTKCFHSTQSFILLWKDLKKVFLQICLIVGIMCYNLLLFPTSILIIREIDCNILLLF